jgi:Putative lumazine-binding
MPQHALILEAITHYAQGWYYGDVARMQKALHPALAKRAWLIAKDNTQH